LHENLYDESECGQVIIVCNRIPDDSNEENANLIAVHKYGFLPDFFRPTKKKKEEPSLGCS